MKATNRLVMAGLLGWSAAAIAQQPPKLPASAAEWRQAARDDIEEGYQLTLDNHPGILDPANPGFADKLRRARDNGLALAAKVTDGAGYTAALARFDASLGDGHAGIGAKLPAQAQVTPRWPGFVTVWRQDGMFVYASEAGGPPAGAAVLSCDGKPMRQVLLDRYFDFEGGRSNEPGEWWSYARNALIDRGNPFLKPLQRCRFAHGGRTWDQALTWRPQTEQAQNWLKASFNGDRLPVGLEQPRPGLFWAAMPTFHPNEQERASYRAMNDQVRELRPRLLEADAVVVDLRHNHGGSSSWSRAFAEALWGKDTVTRAMRDYFAKTETWYRASPGNVAYMTGLIDLFVKEQRPDTAEWARTMAGGMQAAQARNEPFYVHKSASADAEAGPPDNQPPFTRPVYVIVPGQCASACLDALDVLTRFPNTKLVGAPSAADSTYMEVRHQLTRSGLARVSLPIKVYMHRPRANGQVYLPAIYINDVDWSTDNLRRVIENDLAAMGKGTAAVR